MTAYETLDWSVEDGILTLTLDRPDQLNAFTVTMAEELVHAFERASTDDAVAAVVVTGRGRAFCAGMDLSADGNVFGLDETLEPTVADLHDRLDDPAIVAGVRDTGGRVSLAIYACTKPVIAAINGPAVGIGATMTLPMDVRLASEKARIGFVFGKIGVVPEACSTWFLPRIVGISRALEWVYTADILTAAEAHEGGLVRSVHPADELLEAAYALARRFTAEPLPRRDRAGAPDDVPQQRPAAPARGPPGRLARDVLDERRRRQGGRARRSARSATRSSPGARRRCRRSTPGRSRTAAAGRAQPSRPSRSAGARGGVSGSRGISVAWNAW